jgi:hypothetical protein
MSATTTLTAPETRQATPQTGLTKSLWRTGAVAGVSASVADAHTATKVALALSHVVAAAIVIPALASRLSD